MVEQAEGELLLARLLRRAHGVRDVAHRRAVAEANAAPGVPLGGRGVYVKEVGALLLLLAEGEVRAQRLALCDLAGRVLKTGLETLGLETTERM